MNNAFGRLILEEIKKFENSKVSTIRKNTYQINVPKFTAEIFVDEGYHNFELTLDDYSLATKKLKRKLCCLIDNEGVGGDKNQIAKSIEQDIIDALEALRTNKILLGERIGYAAMVIPEGNGFVLVASGRFLDFEAHYNSLDEVREKGKFIQSAQS